MKSRSSQSSGTDLGGFFHGARRPAMSGQWGIPQISGALANPRILAAQRRGAFAAGLPSQDGFNEGKGGEEDEMPFRN